MIDRAIRWRLVALVLAAAMACAAALGASGPRAGRAPAALAGFGNKVCHVEVDAAGAVHARLTVAPGETLSLALAPALSGTGPRHATWSVAAKGGRVAVRRGSARATLSLRLLADGCAFRVVSATAGFGGLTGTVSGTSKPLYAARMSLDARGNPQVYGSGDVLETAAGAACSALANCVYSPKTFRGALLIAGEGGSPRPTPSTEGYTLRPTGRSLTFRALDVWPILGWRPASTADTFGNPGGAKPHIIPRDWVANHRPFPWPELSPVQLPFISMTDPADFPRVKQQVDFLAAKLREWGFYCFGEWPLSQHNPEYGPVRQKAYLAGNRRTCDYAHGKGIKILRWVTDPDIEPSYYPKLYAEFRRKGWLADDSKTEWLLDYTNPGVQKWIERQYAALAATGPDFYWVDNNRPTKPRYKPDVFPPDAFRQFYLAIQRGLASTGRKDILIRSGASAWADYSAVGILDVYAPGPDVQNDWTEQQVSVATELARRDYLCHFNLWRRSIDDYFCAGPQTLDETRAMATLIGLTGLSFTTTDIGLPKIPAQRLEDLRRLVPVATIRPMDLWRFRAGPLPRWWVLNEEQGGHAWRVAGVFNWGLRAEQTDFVPLTALGLDPTREYLAFDFWSQRPIGRFRGSVGLRLAPASGRAIALHPVSDRPFVVATDRHVTMGAAELAGFAWLPRWKELRGTFRAGVTGQTFRLTIYSPPGLRPLGARVGGLLVKATALGDGLYAVPVPCEGPKEAVRIGFGDASSTKPARTGVRAAAAKAGGTGVVDLGAAGACQSLLRPGAEDALLARARRGEAVVLVSPRAWTPELARLQEALGLHWGLFREPHAGAPWMLTVGGGQQEEAGDDLLFRTTCVAFQPSTAEALARPLGKGLVAVVRPDDATPAWRELVRRLERAPAATIAEARAAEREAEGRATSTVGRFTVNAAATEGTASLHVSPALSRVALGFHFRRLSRSLISNEWQVPHVSISVNGRELPHLYDACRPESPPQGWDDLYFAIPAGVLRFDGSDHVTVRSATPATSADAMAADLQAGLELCIETPAEAGRTALVHPPAVALTPAPALDALLGLGGGVRFLARAGGADLHLIGGTPFNGWPAKPGGATYCVYDAKSFVVAVRVPKGSSGTLEAWAYDSDSYRREAMALAGGKPVAVDDFGKGKWLSFPFGPKESANGELRLIVRNVEGANCVLSRVRVRFGGREG